MKVGRSTASAGGGDGLREGELRQRVAVVNALSTAVTSLTSRPAHALSKALDDVYDARTGSPSRTTE